MRHFTKACLLLFLTFVVASCGTKEGVDAGQFSVHARGQLPEINWKAVLMTGDDSIGAFDNAREEMHSIWLAGGLQDENMRQLSMNPREQGGDVGASSSNNLRNAFTSLNVGEGDGCALFMTSHGNTSGFYMRNQPYLTPSQLDQIVTTGCGSQPTVLLISACYSGIFAEPQYEKSNRIILTAARKDRSSFGCSAEEVYTYWDACVIDYMATAGTWENLYAQVKACIERKESQGGFNPSYPQARFGGEMAGSHIFYQ